MTEVKTIIDIYQMRTLKDGTIVYYVKIPYNNKTLKGYVTEA